MIIWDMSTRKIKYVEILMYMSLYHMYMTGSEKSSILGVTSLG